MKRPIYILFKVNMPIINQGIGTASASPHPSNNKADLQGSSRSDFFLYSYPSIATTVASGQIEVKIAKRDDNYYIYSYIIRR